MEKVYADLVQKGLRTLDSVPEKIRDAVKEELDKRKANAVEKSLQQV